MASLGMSMFAVLSLSACSLPEPAVEPARHIVCSDKFSGEFAFSFWDDTKRDHVVVIGGSSFATVTLDNGVSAKVTNADLNQNYACIVDATRAPSTHQTGEPG